MEVREFMDLVQGEGDNIHSIPAGHNTTVNMR